MTEESQYSRTKYFLLYIAAMGAAFLTFKTYYVFEADTAFGVQMMVLNFGILIFLWFLSFVHTDFIRDNLFMMVILPLVGLHITNFMILMMSSGANILGYIGFVLSSSLMIFASYKARIYERNMRKDSIRF